MDHSTFDVIVIGAGPVGENAADRAARSGLSVAVVEHELVGGECSYWACMPSKALLRPGAVLAAARAVPGAAQALTGELDVHATLAGRDEFAAHWDDAAQVQWLADAGLHLVRGHASLGGPRQVRISGDDGEQVLHARHAVLVATGSAAVIPGIPGLTQVRAWTSREVTALRQVPESLAVIGGGVIGTEMATALADLGCAVTLLVRGDQLLSGVEPFAGAAVLESLRSMGVQVHLNTSVTSATRDDDGVLLRTDHGEQVRATEVLVATGRRPRSTGLGLESVGLTEGEALTTEPTGLVQGVDGGWLFAAGDVTGATHTTHHGKYAARVAGDVIAARFGADHGHDGGIAPGSKANDGGGDRWSDLRADAIGVAEAQVVFTRPEVAAVGYTTQQAAEHGLPVRTVGVDLASVAGAGLTGQGQHTDHGPGGATLVIDEAEQTIVGATFVGPGAAELLHAATIAVVGQVPLTRLWHAVPAFPTVSEVWLRLLEEAGL